MELSISSRAMLITMWMFASFKMLMLILIAIRASYALEINDNAYGRILKSREYSILDARRNGERHPIILMAIGSSVALIYSEASLMSGLMSAFMGRDEIITYFTRMDMMNHMVSDTGWTLMLFVVWWAIGHFIREDKCHTE